MTPTHSALIWTLRLVLICKMTGHKNGCPAMHFEQKGCTCGGL